MPPEFRDWLIAKKFGWTKEQIDAQPAVWLDWILAIEHEHSEAENRAMKKGNNDAR